MQPIHLLNMAHIGMVLGLLLSLGAAFMGYWHYQDLSLAQQIAAHALLIPFATVLKVSYIARLVALKQLGRPVN